MQQGRQFSAKFKGCEVAMGAPTLGELRLFINNEHYLNLKSKFDSQASSNLDQNLNTNGANCDQSS